MTGNDLATHGVLGRRAPSRRLFRGVAAVICGFTFALLTAPVLSDEATAESTEARRLWLVGRYEEASAVAQKLTDKSPAAAIVISRVQHDLGDVADSVTTLKSAVAKWPESKTIRGELGLRFLSQGRLNEAFAIAKPAIDEEAPSAPALWVVAETQRRRGRMDEALATYQRLGSLAKTFAKPMDVDGLTWAMRGMLQEARWSGRSEAFKAVVQNVLPRVYSHDPEFWPARILAAELFFEKFNFAQAMQEIDQALSINPACPAAHRLRGRMALDRYNQAGVLDAITKLRRLNANSSEAFRLEGALHLQGWNYASAVKVFKLALQENANDETTLGMLTAAEWAVHGLHRDPPPEVAARIERVHQQNPHCGEFYASLAFQTNAMRKFPFAAPFWEEAIRRAPKRIGPRANLGLLLMRLGREEEASQLLTRSFEIDPYNVRVKNMLEVLDVLKDYATIETEHFVIRYNRGADGVWAEEASRYLEESVYPEITKRLGYKPEGKTLFEVFSNERNTSGHSWFSARMSGLPFIGTVGACAGRIVALTSPNSMKDKFNWARLLRHEFVHVVNLQQTNFHIPHWYTEALAVRMEDSPRPAEWDELLARRYASDSLFNLRNINQGFIRPNDSDDWTLAYCQAELYAHYLAETYGEDTLYALLDAFADNQSIDEAIRTTLQVELDEIERGYRTMIEGLVAQVTLERAVEPPLADLQRNAADNPDDADAQAALAAALLARNRKPQARAAALEAIRLQKDHAIGQYVMARLELSIGDRESAMKRLLSAYDEEAPEQRVLVLLAAVHMQSADYEKAVALFLRGAEAFPHPTRWLKQLARAYLKTADSDALASVLEKLADYDGENLLYRRKLLQIATERDDQEAIAKWANQLLQIDVMDAEHHARLGAARLQLGDAEQAVRSLQTSIQLKPRRNDWRFLLGKSLVAAGDKPAALELLGAMWDEDPEHPGLREYLEDIRK